MHRLSILLVEDSELDMELILAALSDGGMEFAATRVETRAGFEAALADRPLDLILADYALPAFDGLTALKVARERRPEVPCILVSGAMGEERAIEALKSGATDYVLKHRLTRLVPAARRALREAEERAERKRAESALRILADAGRILSSSLDYDTTLKNVANLTVPQLADYCVVNVVDLQGGFRPLAIGRGLELDQHFESLRLMLVQRPDPVCGPAWVLRTGESELIADVDRELEIRPGIDSEMIETVRRLRVRSYICVPLQTHKGVLGTLSLLRLTPERPYCQADLVLAQQLASHAALAVENSRLYHEAQRALKLREELLAMVSHDLKSPLNALELSASALQRDLADDPVASMPGGSLPPITSGISSSGQAGAPSPFQAGASSLVQAGVSSSAPFTFPPGCATAGTSGLTSLPDTSSLSGSRSGRRVVPEAERRKRALRHLKVIRSSAQQMDRLVYALLDLARIEAGCLPIEPECHRVDALLARSIELLAPAAAQKSMQLQVRDEVPGLEVECDEDRFMQVISNLVGNAIKFSPQGALVSVGARPDAEWVQFVVEDSGPGIKQDVLENIFDRFWQAEGRDRRGAGLGLSIARGIVQAHGGNIWVESQIGDGTRFFFTLPKAGSRAASGPDDLARDGLARDDQASDDQARDDEATDSQTTDNQTT